MIKVKAKTMSLLVSRYASCGGVFNPAPGTPSGARAATVDGTWTFFGSLHPFAATFSY